MTPRGHPLRPFGTPPGHLIHGGRYTNTVYMSLIPTTKARRRSEPVLVGRGLFLVTKRITQKRRWCHKIPKIKSVAKVACGRDFRQMSYFTLTISLSLSFFLSLLSESEHTLVSRSPTSYFPLLPETFGCTPTCIAAETVPLPYFPVPSLKAQTKHHRPHFSNIRTPPTYLSYIYNQSCACHCHTSFVTRTTPTS
ncbi:hypothetical protein LX32DRAFT_404450 [Colletotrichum zoysiae]|uniref:Uncharacterized protein n=1 Tax=Colletotrichum zoysiae TaxID=1216348 RepID=A0AAD9M4J8_9PEZI|nr:hypothetical protein LX32DRAFT_404450 [Colletotrichum zoysiae]